MTRKNASSAILIRVKSASSGFLCSFSSVKDPYHTLFYKQIRIRLVMAKLRSLKIESLRFWAFVPKKNECSSSKFFFRSITIKSVRFCSQPWHNSLRSSSILNFFGTLPFVFSSILRYFGSNPFDFLRSWGNLDQTNSFFFQSWGILD